MESYKDKMQESRTNLQAAKNDIESAMHFIDQVSGLEVMDTDGLASLNRMLSIAITIIEGDVRIIDIQTSKAKAKIAEMINEVQDVDILFP